jgi:hypothetical protein
VLNGEADEKLISLGDAPVTPFAVAGTARSIP